MYVLVICSPWSQMAMARHLKLDSVDNVNDEGYDFFDLDLAIDYGKLLDYIRVIQSDYEDTPYHNRIHASDVVQTTNSLIQMADER